MRQKYSGAYLFLGEEPYFIERDVNKIKSLLVSGPMESLNYQIFNGDSVETEALISACETLPLMSDRRLVILNGAQEFIENNRPDDSFYKFLLSLKTTVLLCIEGKKKVPKNQKLYRRLNKGKRVFVYKKLNAGQLRHAIDHYLKINKRYMSPSVREKFILRTGYESRELDVDFYTVANELDKIISLSEEEITENMVDLLIEKSSDENIFDLLDAIARRSPLAVLKSKEELLNREEPIPRILYMIQRQIRLMLGFKLLLNENKTIDYIQKKLGIKSYELKKIQGQSQNFTLDELKSYYPLLVEIDQKLKTTTEDEELLLEILLLKIVNKKAKSF